MRDVKVSKSGAFDAKPRLETEDGVGWSTGARWVVSVVLLVHLAAVLAGALAAPPASPLERAAAEAFAPYHQLIDQGYGYRYYAPEPGPTPVVTARIGYADGRPEETVRLPRRGLLPRLRYQRQLALANHLMEDFEQARRRTGDGANSVYARSYARHLARARPGCATVTLYVQAHLIPDPARVVEELAAGKRVDIDAEQFYTVPERIGEFPCDAF
jgi:hypothetical protein